MARRGHIERYTADELAERRRLGETRSDWNRSAAVTEQELEASIAADPDEAGMEIDWDKASITLPEPKARITVRVDRPVLDFFKRSGPGYQTRINAVLRAYMEAQHKPR